MAAAAVGLLIWNLWLTIELDHLHRETPEYLINDPDEITVVNNTIEGYTTDVTETAEDVMGKLVSLWLPNRGNRRTAASFMR